jgi:hypothetical protein
MFASLPVAYWKPTWLSWTRYNLLPAEHAPLTPSVQQGYGLGHYLVETDDNLLPIYHVDCLRAFLSDPRCTKHLELRDREVRVTRAFYPLFKDCVRAGWRDYVVLGCFSKELHRSTFTTPKRLQLVHVG